MARRPRTGFKEICEHYEQRIRKGELKPGQVLPAEPDLARQHGVARTTLRRAFEILVRKGLVIKKPGQGTFIASTEQIEERSLGSVAVLAPGSMLTESSASDGALEGLSGISGGEHYQILEGVTTTLASYGRMTHTYYLRRDGREDAKVSRAIRGGGDAGLIAMGFEADRREYVMSLGLPTVFIDSVTDGLDVDAIQSANRDGMAKGTRHVLDTTTGLLAFVGSERKTPPNPHTERLQGFLDACRRTLRRVPEDHLFFSAVHVNGGREVAREILKLNPLPSGIVCSDDRLAMGIIDVFRDRGISVPNDVSVVGFGGALVGLMVIPTISTVAPNHLRMGEEAVHLLEKRLRSPGRQTRTVHVPTNLCLRGSTRGIGR